jgi:hypothetical protein
VLGAAAVLVPKCPLCLAAYLAVVGIGAGAATTVSRVIHPLLLAVAVLGLFVPILVSRYATTKNA